MTIDTVNFSLLQKIDSLKEDIIYLNRSIISLRTSKHSMYIEKARLYETLNKIKATLDNSLLTNEIKIEKALAIIRNREDK